MPIKSFSIGKHVNYRKLIISLFMIFVGAVMAGRFDGWYPLIGGALIAVAGCFLNQQSIKWLSEVKDCGNDGLLHVKDQ